MAGLFCPTFSRKRSSGKGDSDGEIVVEHSVVGDRIGEVRDGMLSKPFELVIIGGGPVGVAAALEASALGRRALLVDKPKFTPNAQGLDISFGGPTGLTSKALREAGKAIDVLSLKSMGLYDDVIWGQVRRMCDRLASMNAEHQVKLLRDFKVEYLQGFANIDGSGERRASKGASKESPRSPKAAGKKLISIHVQTEDGRKRKIETSQLLLATGSKPQRPAHIPYDDVRIFDSDTIAFLDFLPKDVVINGGGIISIEYAKIFRQLGANVTLLVRSTAKSSLARIGLDEDIADQLLSSLRKDNVAIYETTEVVGIELENKMVLQSNPSAKSLNSNFSIGVVTAVADKALCVSLKSTADDVPQGVNCDVFLAALGRRPNVSGFGLEKVGVKLAKDGGHIEVDEFFQTNVPGIYAAGDVIGPPALASTGVHQAKGAVTAMFDEGVFEKRAYYPVGVWTVPEISYYGLTKAAALKQGLDVEEGVAPYTGCLRGRVFAPEGLLKLVFHKGDGVIVGVHMIGADACELVHYGMDLVEQKVTIFSLISTLYTAVTYHELFKEAALNGNSKLKFGFQWQALLSDLAVEASDQSLDLESLNREFRAMDTNGDGHVGQEELLALFKKLGKQVRKGTIANLIRLGDEDGNGSLEWEEFVKIYTEAITHKKKMTANIAKHVTQRLSSRDL